MRARSSFRCMYIVCGLVAGGSLACGSVATTSEDDGTTDGTGDGLGDVPGADADTGVPDGFVPDVPDEVIDVVFDAAMDVVVPDAPADGPAEVATDVSDVSTDAGPRCGNGIREAPEQCDDGNANNEDGCTTTCRFSCESPEVCPRAPVCQAAVCVVGGTGRICGVMNVDDPCDDGDPCTTGDRCVAGVCVATGRLPVWYRDGDGDGHGNDTVTTCANVQPAGYVPAAGDCCDSNSQVHPGVRVFRPDSYTCGPAGTSSWDWNCDGIVEQEYPNCETCSLAAPGTPAECAARSGWQRSGGCTVPGCGASEILVTCLWNAAMGACTPSGMSESALQRCR